MVGAVVLPRATQEREVSPTAPQASKTYLLETDFPARHGSPTSSSRWRVLQPEWADTGRHIGSNPAPLLRTPFGERSLGSSASSRSNPEQRIQVASSGTCIAG